MEQTVASERAATSTAVSARSGKLPIPPPAERHAPKCAEVSATGLARDQRDSYAVTALADITDRSLHAAVARITMGLSPAAMAHAYLDWATHLAGSPGKRLQLVDKAFRKAVRLANHSARCALTGASAEPCIVPLPLDRRFAGVDWQKWPYNLIHQTFLLNQQWWYNATTGVRGVSKQHEMMAEFMSRQILDMVSPSNFLLTNPEALRRTIEQGGANLVTGFQNMLEDWECKVSGKKPAGAENFVVGRDVAVTPGKVVYRNRLIELIQYAPTTDKVRPEPVLIVPAWIMKYYILDLSPQNSLVKYLTAQGFTVFMISWKNVSEDDRDLGMEDYRTLGIMAALDAVNAIVPERKVHAAGYCLGGTLQSITLLAAQTDFTEAGELMLFINESQLAFLEDMMWEQGFLDTAQMAGAFQMLRSNDLIWSYMTRNYLMGEREPMSDLMAWNADVTRLPYRMHSEYLRRLFLDNDLAEGRYRIGSKPVTLSDIRLPIFAVGTLRDHVAPWRSTFKIHLLTDTEVTYLLTSGGHNAGIVSEPDHDGRSFQIVTRGAGLNHVDSETWAAETPRQTGSWWPEWVGWLDSRSGPPGPPPALCPAASGYGPLADAPGRYVLQS